MKNCISERRARGHSADNSGSRRRSSPDGLFEFNRHLIPQTEADLNSQRWRIESKGNETPPFSGQLRVFHQAPNRVFYSFARSLWAEQTRDNAN